MKFCPKCGTILMPERREGKLILKCPRCSYEVEVRGDIKKDYMIEERADLASRVKTTSIVSEGGAIQRSKEEIEQEKEEFYEVFLELMSSEEGGEEGSSE